MRVKLNAFPVVYLNGLCRKHHCIVELQVQGDQPNVGHVMPLRCKIGGEPATTDCTEDWELILAGNGDITITR